MRVLIKSDKNRGAQNIVRIPKLLENKSDLYLMIYASHVVNSVNRETLDLNQTDNSVILTFFQHFLDRFCANTLKKTKNTNTD